MSSNAKDTLKKLSADGYKLIESFEGSKGMFWGWKNTEFKSIWTIWHEYHFIACNNTVDFERKAAEAAEIGMKYLICPYKGPQKSIDDLKSLQTSSTNAVRYVKRTGSGLRIITMITPSRQLTEKYRKK